MSEWFQQRASHRSHEQGPFRPAGTRSAVLYVFCVLLEHALEDSMSIPSHFSRSLEVLQVVLHAHTTSIAARGGAGSFKRLKLYNSEEHVPIESFVTTLIH